MNLTRTTAVENAHAGIRYNVILPGPIAAPLKQWDSRGSATLENALDFL
ncbi:MAG: hypothetical protein ACNA7T_11665 [Haliea sp.]